MAIATREFENRLTYADHTGEQAVGHLIKLPGKLQVRYGLVPPTTARMIGIVKNQLHELNVARKAKTISRFDYNESKRALHEKLSAYWEQFNKERRF